MRFYTSQPREVIHASIYPHAMRPADIGPELPPLPRLAAPLIAGEHEWNFPVPEHRA